MTDIVEYIEKGRFNSKDHGFYVIEHNAPSPEEVEIIEDIPFMQGVYDFSMLLGERIFQNRTVSVKLYKPLTPYDDRKRVEQEVKEQLMTSGQEAIFDTWLDGCHWYGKCKSVDAKDSEEYHTLTLDVVFDCYPFALKNAAGYNDEFDVDYFVDGVDGWTGFWVNGKRQILLINDGVNAISPMMTATSDMQLILSDGSTVPIKKGENRDLFFKLARGENYLTLIGNGHVSFETETEVMV